MSSNNQQDFSTDLLKVYYDRLFPYTAMYNWLSYGYGGDYFFNREWSFTMEDDIYIRYQCFRDENEMKTAIQKRQPHKIDIGAVFTNPPKEHATLPPEKFKTEQRELVFDVDMTDYDDIRTCCSGANICHRCWPFMTMALKCVHESLVKDFGFKNILWVYSGRRGVHCWVCDPQARELANDARSAVVEYLSVHVSAAAASGAEGGKKAHKASLSYPLHPMIRRAFLLLEPYFEVNICDGVSGQGLLDTKEKCTKLVNTITNPVVKQALLTLIDGWKDKMGGAQRWRQIRTVLSNSNSLLRSTESSDAAVQSAISSITNNKKTIVNYKELEQWAVELVLTYCYPRLDANVSKAQNHLLKSPFCIHPKTGRVCVPIDPSRADEFDPLLVPTLGTLVQQLDQYEKAHPNNGEFDLNKTDMKGVMATFERTFMGGMMSANRKIKREQDDMTAAATLDF